MGIYEKKVYQVSGARLHDDYRNEVEVHLKSHVIVEPESSTSKGSFSHRNSYRIPKQISCNISPIFPVHNDLSHLSNQVDPSGIHMPQSKFAFSLAFHKEMQNALLPKGMTSTDYYFNSPSAVENSTDGFIPDDEDKNLSSDGSLIKRRPSVRKKYGKLHINEESFPLNSTEYEHVWPGGRFQSFKETRNPVKRDCKYMVIWKDNDCNDNMAIDKHFHSDVTDGKASLVKARRRRNANFYYYNSDQVRSVMELGSPTAVKRKTKFSALFPTCCV